MSILPRDWRLLQRNYNFEKNQSQLETFHLNAFLYVLKKHLCEGKINVKFHWHYISVWSTASVDIPDETYTDSDRGQTDRWTFDSCWTLKMATKLQLIPYGQYISDSAHCYTRSRKWHTIKAGNDPWDGRGSEQGLYLVNWINDLNQGSAS